MRIRLLLARGAAAALAACAAGVFLAPPVSAAPSLPDPGPIQRNVRLYELDPAALPAVNSRLDEVLDHVSPANRSQLAGRTVTVHVIPQHGHLTDLAEFADKRGEAFPDQNPNDNYDDERMWDDFRGFASSCGTSGSLNVYVGEEQIVALPHVNNEEGYNSPPAALLGYTLVHEVGHALQCGLTSTQGQTLTTLYDAAFARYPDDVLGNNPAYTVSSRSEYFAEATAAWFESGGVAAPGADNTYRRAWLAGHDPALRNLLGTVFDVPPAPFYCGDQRATTVMTAPGTFTGNAGPDIIVGTSGADIIDGTTGDDVICGGNGNDTITGGRGADDLRGEQGNDDLRGGSGNDKLLGGLGNDRYDGGSDNDTLFEQPFSAQSANGDDVMNGGAGNDILTAGIGNDTLTDHAGQDTLEGNAGDDSLSAVDEQGTSPPDTLEAGDDFDWCNWDVDADDVTDCERWPNWPRPPRGVISQPSEPPEHAPVPAP
jgi:hypothetical protein